ncbi:MAG: hypothetical protein ACYDBJ_04530 [Aggregatilineales bacterium]
MTVVIRFIRMNRWEPPDGGWLKPGDYPADTLLDLATSNNILSVYYVETEAEIERVAIAIAANRDQINVVDYVVVDLSAFEQIRVEPKQVRGDTPDEVVNTWHRDLIQLSVHRMVDLVGVMWGAKKKRIQQKRVKELLVENAVKGYIKRGLIKKETMQNKLDDLLKIVGSNWAG